MFLDHDWHRKYLYKQGINKLKWISNEITVRLYGALNIYKSARSKVASGQQYTVFFKIIHSVHYYSITTYNSNKLTHNTVLLK